DRHGLPGERAVSFTLRPYQERACERAWTSIMRGERPFVVSPTGSGKTVVAASLIDRARSEGMRVALMTPRQEILWQTVSTIRAFGHEPGILMGDATCRRYEPVQVVCWPTLVQRSARSESWFPDADLVLIDECHLALSKKMRERVLPYYESSKVIGFTATPARTGGHGLGDYFTDMLEITTIPALIEEGFRSEEHTSELQSREKLVCRLLLEKQNPGAFDELLRRTVA